MPHITISNITSTTSRQKICYVCRVEFYKHKSFGIENYEIKDPIDSF